MPELRVETWPVSRLVPYASNPRKNDQAVERMVAALRAYGFRVPLIVRSDGELVDGHLRLKAALSMDLTEVPVLLADDLTPEQVRAFRLMINRSATWAAWDDDALALEIAALLSAECDLRLTGFDQSELDRLFRALSATNPDPDAVPDPPAAPVVREGELWLLGPHRLLCGDSLNSLHLGRLLDGRAVEMIWTDPPYNVDYHSRAGSIKNDRMSAARFAEFLGAAFARMFEALRPGGAIYVAHSEAGDGLAFRLAFRDAGFRFAACLIWNKGQAVLGRGDYHWQHEPILYGWRPGTAHRWRGNRKARTILEAGLSPVVLQDDGSYTLLLDGQLYRLSGDNIRITSEPGTVINIPKPSRSDLHPTTKPVELVAHCVANSSATGDTALDPFGGSGSTLIACEQLNRCACLMELDQRYAQVIIERWQGYTGRQAVRDSDGVLFDELVPETVSASGFEGVR